MKVVNFKKPLGFRDTKLNFNSLESAELYVSNLEEKFNSKKNELEKRDLSKLNRNKLRRIRKKKYLLTKQGKKFRLWEELK